MAHVHSKQFHHNLENLQPKTAKAISICTIHKNNLVLGKIELTDSHW